MDDNLNEVPDLENYMNLDERLQMIGLIRETLWGTGVFFEHDLRNKYYIKTWEDFKAKQQDTNKRINGSENSEDFQESKE
jgi:hypothetical protein